MKIAKSLSYFCAIAAFCFSSCKDEFFDYGSVVEEGLPAQINLSFAAEKSPVVSRASQDEKTENSVHNLRLFIFNDEGNIIFNQFYGEGQLPINGELTVKTTSANKAKIIGIANLPTEETSTAYEISNDLSKIQTLSELQNIVANLLITDVNRSSAFMMSAYATNKEGTTTDILIPPLDNSQNHQLDAVLSLKRLDAKVTFNVTSAKPDNKNWTNFSFQPREWRVCQVPKQSLAVEDENKDYDAADAKYFVSEFLPFESVDRDDKTALYSGGSFTFYMPENRKKYKNEITTNSYALREKREEGDKVNDPNKPGQSHKPGDFFYANPNSTYVEMTGSLSYRDEKNYLVSASVKYIIHLGYVNGVNDYDTHRNTYYTYNVKVRGINDIEVEVTQATPGDDPRPGYEGDVVYSSNQTYFLDAHYDRALLHIKRDEIKNMSWGVNTPYSVGIYNGGNITDNLADYKWIKFAINKDYNTDAKKYVKYPGDQNYKGGEDKESGYNLHPSGARMLDVKQLIERLKEENNNVNSTIFESDDGTVSVTAFIDEYVYVRDPRYPDETEDLSMWKVFTEANDRQMHLTNGRSKFSPDGNSSVVESMYTFRQKSIRTIYDKNSSSVQKAWGLETVMEVVGDPNNNGKGIRLEVGDLISRLSVSSDDNGRQNSIKMLEGLKWTDIINVDEGESSLKEGKQNAVYACLTRNRDLNGDDKVQAREIRWYLAAINQLTDIYIGQNALDVDAHLFPQNEASRPGGNGLYWHYTSSSREGNKNNPWVLWAEEGAARGSYNSSQNNNGKFYAYRCVRNLGINLDNIDETPDPLITAQRQTDGTYIVDATRLNPKARRGYVAAVLPDHDDIERDNLLYDKFRVNNVDSDIPTPDYRENLLGTSNWWANEITWAKCKSLEQSMSGGYRLPNERELLVMLNVLPEDAWTSYRAHYDRWERDTYSKAMYMCKTRFSKAGMKPFEANRESFRMNAQDGSIGVIDPSSGNDKGYIRGVKDER